MGTAARVTTDFATQLKDDIANNRLTLPTLPEVALQVRDAVEQENITAREIANMVARDAALSARLLQVANSPLYRARTEIDSIQMAVTRLGSKLVRSLVISLAMKQIFQATSDALDKEFRAIWEDSLQVAAISRVLATNLSHLDNEQAMLAGLIHNIGALPILTKLDELHGFEVDEAMIRKHLAHFAPEVGEAILKFWELPAPLVAVPRGCMDLGRDHEGPADYADLVLVSRLQHLSGGQDPEADLDWNRIPAISRVGVEPEVVIVDLEGPAEDIAEVRAMFDG